jgi:phosphate transport system substrate-binding protein
MPDSVSIFGLNIDWTGEQFVAAVSLVAALVPLLALILPAGRKRILYRVSLDAPVSVLPGQVGRTEFGLGIKVLHDGTELVNPSLVLIRVKNAGRRVISRRDWEVPLHCRFGGRTVVAAEVTTARDKSLMSLVMPTPAASEPGVVDDSADHERASTGAHQTDATCTYLVTRPFGLNRREWFRLLVLVAETGDGVQVRGRLEDGHIVKDHTNRRPGVRTAALTGVALALIGLAAGLLLSSTPSISEAHTQPSYCREGRLIGEGSTAFEEFMDTLGRQYAKDCPGALVEYTPTSSAQGTARLGRIDPAEAPRRLAMSDGRALADGSPNLAARRVAILVFAVVVNEQVDARVKNLTKAQLQSIFTGEYTNWNKIVRGFNMPIHVIGRSSTSGTRRAFESKVLDGRSEQQPTSDDCEARRDRSRAGGIRCEPGDTQALLEEVQQTEGAIGYAELAAATDKRYVATVQINGISPNAAAVRGGLYDFWTVEYVYTYGQPSADSIVAGFLDFLSSPFATTVLESDQHLACTSDDVSRLCQEER